MLDDNDISRQYCQLYAQGNIVIRKCRLCLNVKNMLFTTFCLPMYTAHLWWNVLNYGGMFLTMLLENCMTLTTIYSERY